MESSTVMVWSLLFGSLGLGYLSYGRKQKQFMPALCGVALMVYPYFIASTPLLLLIGATLAALPWFIKF